MKTKRTKTGTLAAVASLGVMLLTGCSDDADKALRARGTNHRVTLYSGGNQIGQWTTSGKVATETHSDGYYFNDAATHKLIRISGTVVIEMLE